MPRLSKYESLLTSKDSSTFKLYRQIDGSLSSSRPPLSIYSQSNRAIYAEIVLHCQKITGITGREEKIVTTLDHFDPLDSPTHPFNSEPWKSLVDMLLDASKM